MNNKMFKLSIISSALLATTQVSAALYNVMEVSPDSVTSDYNSVYGVAIQPIITSAANDNCFVNSTVESIACDEYALAGETRTAEMNNAEAVDGLSFREEAPFAMDNRFTYIQSKSDFQDYCEAELRYSTCSYWASVRWNVWSSELSETADPIAVGFIGTSSSSDTIYDSANVVINSISPSTGNPVGIDSGFNAVTGYRRDSVTAHFDGTAPSSSTYLQSRAWKTDGTYTVGSVSNEKNSYYSSNAALWESDGTTYVVPWDSSTEVAGSENYYAQGSMRDFVVDSGTGDVYAVGFNSYSSSRNSMNATIFKSNSSDLTSWSSVLVEETQAYIDGTHVHSNSVITSINDNLVAIGTAKRIGKNAKNRSAANRLFIIPNVSTSTSATFPSGGILFSGAGGKAGAINNYNEIVGQVDFDSTNELDGKPRRKRGFIYPYNGTGTDATRRARFKNQAWYLDDLTNDGSTSGNNQYRVIDATDINDAGVISATALKCDGGYDTTAHNSTCGGGSQTEKTVAVKLVPKLGATASNITERGIDENSSSERSGAGLGLWGFILLGLAWFRRK